MWAIKLKFRDTDRRRHGGDHRPHRVKGAKDMVTEGDQSLGGGHTMQYTNHVSQSCTPDTCMTLLTNVTPIGLIKKLKTDRNSTTS